MGLPLTTTENASFAAHVKDSYSAFLQSRATRLQLQALQYYSPWLLAVVNEPVLKHGLKALLSHHALLFGQVWQHKIIKHGHVKPQWVRWYDVFTEWKHHYYQFVLGCL